jgi:hypothetical protein
VAVLIAVSFWYIGSRKLKVVPLANEVPAESEVDEEEPASNN